MRAQVPWICTCAPPTSHHVLSRAAPDAISICTHAAAARGARVRTPWRAHALRAHALLLALARAHNAREGGRNREVRARADASGCRGNNHNQKGHGAPVYG